MIARTRTPGLTWIPLPSSGMDLDGPAREPAATTDLGRDAFEYTRATSPTARRFRGRAGRGGAGRAGSGSCPASGVAWSLAHKYGI